MLSNGIRGVAVDTIIKVCRRLEISLDVIEDANSLKQNINDIENDKSNPTTDTPEKIDNALEVSMDKLLGKSFSGLIGEQIKK